MDCAAIGFKENGGLTARPMVFSGKNAMAVMRILIDGHTFESPMKDGADAADIEAAAKDFGVVVSRMGHLSTCLNDGSFLVFGEK